MNYTLYNRKTGEIVGTTNDLYRAKQNGYIEGTYMSQYYYVANNTVVKKPPKPTPNYSWYEYNFNYNTKQYELDIEKTAFNARVMRNNMFQYVDKVSPMWYSSMTPEQQLITSSFRESLLEVTKQPNFPLEIDWPTVPSFLK